MTTRTKRQVRTRDGVADAELLTPDGDGPWPAVILFMDAGGVRPAIVEMAERFASNGYVVLVPNLFYRSGEFAPFDLVTVWGDAEERSRLMALIKSLDVESAMSDVGGYLDAISGEPEVISGKVGLVGYCLGGRLAFSAASAHPERVGAVASIHGGHLATDAPDSPHLAAAKIQASLYIAVADDDTSATPEHQGMLVSALSSAHLDYRLEHYAGKKHGFAVSDFPIFDASATERHFARVLDLFASSLPRRGV